MHRRLIRISALALAGCLGQSGLAQSTLEAPVGEYLDYPLTLLEPGAGGEPIGQTVSVEGAAWLRLYFGEVFLSPGSVVRVTSALDGETQTLDGPAMAMWNDTTAYFNGDTVFVELQTAPGAAEDRLVLARVAFETPATVTPRGDSSECGICGTDDRVASNEDWVGRLMPIGCTAEVFNRNGCALTAGHCMQSNQLIEFRVPASNPNCTMNHPPVADQFPVVQRLSSNNGVGDDWAVLRMGVNNLGQTSVQRYGRFMPLATALSVADDPIEFFGYGVDHTCVVSQTQRHSEGEIDRRRPTWYEFTGDLRGGNSGSGLVHEGRLIGVITHCSDGCPNFATRIDVTAFAEARAAICPVCDSDLDGSGMIDIGDLSVTLASFGCMTPPCPGDVDGDGDTDVEDVSRLLADFGLSCD